MLNIFFIIIVITYTIGSAVRISNSCQGESIQDLNASYILGGLFPVHRFKDNKYEFNIEAVVWVEAFLFAINQINKNKELLPGIKLGYDIRDNCDGQTMSKLHILDLMSDIKFFIKTNDTQQQNFDENNGKSFSKTNDRLHQQNFTQNNTQGDEFDITECQCFHENQSHLIGVVGKFTLSFFYPSFLLKIVFPFLFW